MDDSNVSGKPTRRELMKTALAAGAYAAPLILTATVPATLSAQVSGTGTGTVSGIITNALTGLPISGATFTFGSRQVTTSATGAYTLTNVPSGVQSFISSAPGFGSRNDSVSVAATGITTFSPALVAGSITGVTIVLTWGATPSDLDSHLTGPNGATRFHMYYADRNPVAYAMLDVDDVTSFGPETTTVSQVGGNFVAGDYHYYIHNYSGSPGINSSSPNPVITVFQSGAQIAQFSAGAATGSDASPYWQVFNFTLTATPTGTIVITPIQTFTSVAPAGADDIRRNSKGGVRRSE